MNAEDPTVRAAHLENTLRAVAKRANHLEDRVHDSLQVEKGLEPILTGEPVTMTGIRSELSRLVGEAMLPIWDAAATDRWYDEQDREARR